jgi:hypothetical protein
VVINEGHGQIKKDTAILAAAGSSESSEVSSKLRGIKTKTKIFIVTTMRTSKHPASIFRVEK